MQAVNVLILIRTPQLEIIFLEVELEFKYNYKKITMVCELYGITQPKSLVD